MSQVLIRAHEVSLQLAHTCILEAVNLRLEAGQITTLIGANGSGKTSLLKILMGLQQPSSGRVERRANLALGYMPQKLMLETHLPIRVVDFLALAPLANTQQINYWLDKLNILQLYKHSLHRLSGGQWQRVLLARALLNRPDILFLDEPMQGIDVSGQKELYRLIPVLRDELQCAVFMVSHDLHLVMAATDEVICLNKHICCSGHPSEVSQNPAYLNLFGQEYAPYVHHHNHEHHLCEGCEDKHD